MRVVRYFFVGGVSSLTDLVIFSTGVKLLEFRWLYVAMFSFLIATLVNYILSVRYVFESGIRFRKSTEILLVFFVSGVGLCVNLLALWFLIEVFNLDEVLSKIYAVVTTFFWNYAARNFLIFKKKNERAIT
jgi:putative flippase GtrA